LAQTSAHVHIPPQQWSQKQTHCFTAHHDIRKLLVIDHSWAPSRRGGFGEWKVKVAPPDGWRQGSSLSVSFYQSDNYSSAWRESDWMGAQVFVGHRFKQLFVNGHLVWEQDVADEEMAGSIEGSFAAEPGDPGYLDSYRVVDITEHAGPEIVLAFRVADKVASTTKLPGDAYSRFSWSSFDPEAAAKNFQTSVYLGDVYLTVEGRVVRPEEQPVTIKKADLKPGGPIPGSGIPLSLAVPGKLPVPGYPVRSGIPLPKGSVSPATPFALIDSKGKEVPLNVTETSHWPDGSVRWLLCEFVAEGKRRYKLKPGAVSCPPKAPVRIRTRNDMLTVTNGILKLRLDKKSGQGVCEGLTSAQGLLLGPVDLSIKLNRVGWRESFTAHRRRVAVERSDAILAILRIEGDLLNAEKQRFGPWRVRFHVWAGLPYVLVDWRLVNESDQSMAVLLDWSARVSLPDLEEATVDFGPFTPGHDPEDIGVKAMGHHGRADKTRSLILHRESELSCRQERADQARIYRNTSWVATADTAEGFAHIAHDRGDIVASMRWFAEEFPKGIVTRPDLLSLATLPESEDALGWPHDRPIARIGRGEAKRQTFALWLNDGKLSRTEAERFNRCVQDPPHLFNPSWFINSGALEAGPLRNRPGLEGWAKSVTPVIERTGIGAPRLGHREYWDTAWSNDYRGRAHLGLIQYIETGGPKWFRYFDAACTHTRDVDIIHFCPEHPEWVGATHQYGEDHTTCGPMGNIGLNCDSLLEHYLMTGDPDSFDAARGLAEHVLKCSPWSRSARAVGWPLSQIVRWYEQTGDKRFLRKARGFVDAARSYVEPRRGIFNEMHGCWNYRGTVPFMTGYLAFGLIRYFHLTEDAEVLKLMRLLAFGLFAESHPRKGRFRYSPYPENNRSPGWCRTWNALVGGLAGALFQATGEALYAEWAQECYEGIVEDAEEMQITMDMLQNASWMLQSLID
jgi:hypothetical protein